ncbi:MAG: hypothetical protein ACI8QC_000467 [Planctomycetota bacterium]|jgi:hypothetical protein
MQRSILLAGLVSLLPLIILGIPLGAALEASQDGKSVTYDDTPMLPGQPYKVHGPRPEPRVVAPGAENGRPADAISLFDGSDLSEWRSGDKDAGWKVVGDYMEVNGTGSIQSRREFGDVQLHVEFATPAEVKGASQGRGNSGVFFFGRYEIQVLDSYENPSYPDGQCASIYGQYPPRVNACRAPGVWQTYDIVFRAPRFAEDGSVSEPARVTVMHNGIFVHVDQPMIGSTAHRNVGKYSKHADKGSIQLQDHGNPVRYRNIWIRPLGEYDK